MRSGSNSKESAVRLAITAAATTGLAIASLLAAVPGPVSAATPSPASARGPVIPNATFHDAVTFIGDSVTAGFGYCGIAENAPRVNCGSNQEMANSWYREDNSLSDCAPPDAPAPLTDACSNDNDNGRPWDAGAWRPGPLAPTIAYPYQIAASQSGASVSDWAITGSTPADWDPDGGTYGPQLAKIQHQYVVMTLGANPILSYYTNIDFNVPFVPDVRGPCVYSTGYHSFFQWYAGPIDRTLGCLDDKWDDLGQTQHLVNIYEKLLKQDDRVLVLGYYRACSWSFGNWQPDANLFRGPAAGHSCRDEVRPTSFRDRTAVTQWDQAVAVGDAVNARIHDAVVQAQDWAKNEWPRTDRYKDLAWTQPDQTAWAQHQPDSAAGSWVLLNDTWIHPDKEGAAQLARTVTAAMCSDFRHWCGSRPVWSRR